MSNWFQNARPISLPQSLLPALTAVALSYGQTDFSWIAAIASLAGVVALHLGFNLLDDWFDYKAGSAEARQKVSNEGFRGRMIKYPYLTSGECTEYLALDLEKRAEIIDKVLEYKRKGYPIMNSKSGLKLMKTNKFVKRCWVTNFIYPDGTRGLCVGNGTDKCDQCGFCMSGEMASVFAFRPDTIFAGLKLRG